MRRGFFSPDFDRVITWALIASTPFSKRHDVHFNSSSSTRKHRKLMHLNTLHDEGGGERRELLKSFIEKNEPTRRPKKTTNLVKISHSSFLP